MQKVDLEHELILESFETIDRKKVVLLEDAIKIVKLSKMQGILLSLSFDVAIARNPNVERAVNNIAYEFEKMLQIPARTFKIIDHKEALPEIKKMPVIGSESREFLPTTQKDGTEKVWGQLPQLVNSIINNLERGKEYKKSIIKEKLKHYSKASIVNQLTRLRLDGVIRNGINDRWFVVITEAG